MAGPSLTRWTTKDGLAVSVEGPVVKEDGAWFKWGTHIAVYDESTDTWTQNFVPRSIWGPFGRKPDAVYVEEVMRAVPLTIAQARARRTDEDREWALGAAICEVINADTEEKE